MKKLNESERKELSFNYIDSEGRLLKKLNFSYSLQTSFSRDTLNVFDAESFILYDEHILLFSKNRKNYETYVYRLDTSLTSQNIEPFDTLNTKYLVTGAFMARNATSFFLVGYDYSRNHYIDAYNITKHGEIERTLNKRIESLKGMQVEAITLIGNEIYLTSEAESNKNKPQLITITL